VTSGGSRGPRHPTYTSRMTDAIGFPCRDPLRLLALAVIMRWLDDGAADEIGTEWAAEAEVPERWLREAALASR